MTTGRRSSSPAIVDSGLGPTPDPNPPGSSSRLRALRSSPWLMLAVALIGAYGTSLNATIIGVALPAIEDDLGSVDGALDADWVVTSFLIGMVLIQPATAWLADRWGRSNIYSLSLCVFALGAFVCGTAPNMSVLVAGRLVQGFGAGSLIPIGLVIVYELFPAGRRGTALGVWGVGMAASPAAGPPLGGWIVTAASWRWIFGIFFVVAAVAIVLTTWLLTDSGHREQRRLDGFGWLLGAVGLLLVVITARLGPDWGFTSPTTLVSAGGAALALAVLVRRSLSRPEPIIDFRVFSTPTFSIAMLVVSLASFAQYARLTFLPIELQVVRGFDASEVGLILGPAAVGVATTMPLGGWLADRVGSRAPVLIGLTLIGVSMWQLAHLDSTYPKIRISLVLILQGVGSGLVFAPTLVAAMNSVSDRFAAQVSATRSMTRHVSAAIGVAVLGSILVSDLGSIAPVAPPLDEAQAAYNRLFLVALWVVILAIVLAVFLPGSRSGSTHRSRLLVGSGGRRADLGATDAGRGERAG